MVMREIIVQWTEADKTSLDVDATRVRAFEYDSVDDVIYDKTNGVDTLALPVELLSNKDMKKLKTHEARKLVDFCKKKKGKK